ncbi:hypothetical protein DERF_003605 [Dermatophagoides farinae]|uniref:Uncharacterized protein n=1 Tax=Dermatophagoides farinae TaxID=6954 RepID=A0A922IF12_DERFA|nr:hypothetical protein DERF_003605 [Dermatophagoides farinae]
MVVIFTRSVGPYFFDENEKEKHNKQTNKISTNIDDDDIYQIASQPDKTVTFIDRYDDHD